MNDVQAYPLQWPEGIPRTPSYQRKRSRWGTRSLDKVVKILQAEVKRADGFYLTVSTNVALRRDGLPYSDYLRKGVDDPGIAVYFERKGRTICFPCDAWKTVEENIYAVFTNIESLRRMERSGVAEAVDRAFEGYAMLPSVSQAGWKELLLNPFTLAEAEQAFRLLAKKYHPDNQETGDAAKMAELNGAIRQAREYFKT